MVCLPPHHTATHSELPHRETPRRKSAPLKNKGCGTQLFFRHLKSAPPSMKASALLRDTCSWRAVRLAFFLRRNLFFLASTKARSLNLAVETGSTNLPITNPVDGQILD